MTRLLRALLTGTAVTCVLIERALTPDETIEAEFSRIDAAKARPWTGWIWVGDGET